MSCQNIRQALAECLQRTDCVLKHDRTPQDCLHNHADELPVECQQLRKAYFECKRGMVSWVFGAKKGRSFSFSFSLSL